MKLLFDTIQTPIGQVVLVVENQNLCFVDFEGNEHRMKQLLEKRLQQQARGVFCGRFERHRRYPRFNWRHGISTKSLARVESHPNWSNPFLRRNGSQTRATNRLSSRGHDQWFKPNINCAALPSCDWRFGNIDGLCWRAGTQEVVARA
jgi:hypothetical protein